MDLQTLVDAISRMGDEARKNYHVLLGDLISELEKVPPTTPVTFSTGRAPSRPHSYRGYYCDLAFDSVDTATAGDVLILARGALGSTFEGYKGGDFTMRADTPLWHSAYGTTGDAIVAINVTDVGVVLVTKHVD